MDVFVKHKPEKMAELRKHGKLKWANINDACDKNQRQEACQYIAYFFYQLEIPINVWNFDSFKWAIKAIE